MNSSTGCYPLIYRDKEVQVKYAPQLTESLLVAHQAVDGKGFAAYCGTLGIWEQQGSTPDHIAGVRDRLLAVNVNAMGSSSWAESSWDIFSQSATLSPHGRGGKVSFLEAIFEALKVGEEAKALAEEQRLGPKRGVSRSSKALLERLLRWVRG